MAIKNLEIFTSYFDSKQIQKYLNENDVDGISEVSGVIETDAGILLKIGGILRATKEFHAGRLAETDLTFISAHYHDQADAPEVPWGAYWAGVFYYDDPKTGDVEIMPVEELEYNHDGKVLTVFWKVTDEDAEKFQWN